MTYIDEARAALVREMPDEDPALIDLYLLLAMRKGVNTTARDVHDAWAIWRARTRPTHPAIIPFDALAPHVQYLDDPYVEAIHRAAGVMVSG